MAWDRITSAFSGTPPSVLVTAPSIATSRSSRLPVVQLHPYVLIGGASLGTLLLLRTLSGLSGALTPTKPKVIPSPREKVLQLSAEEGTTLPYPLDALPGGRDVDSQFGSIRVYEWGPEDGDKILLIHGISTPSIALADLAHKLVHKGCRVMLFGRSSLLVSSMPSHPHRVSKLQNESITLSFIVARQKVLASTLCVSDVS